MLTSEENELLCRVEGMAPMGQLMRRHWLPACLIEEVPDPDGAPVPLRLLALRLESSPVENCAVSGCRLTLGGSPGSGLLPSQSSSLVPQVVVEGSCV